MASKSIPRGEVVLEHIRSRRLRGNLLGDPPEKVVPVYLPPGYGRSKSRRYPSLYLLSGFTGRGVTHLNVQSWGETLPARMDRLIAAGKIGPMIVVMPDGWTRFGGGQYVNSATNGPYEDHIVKEIVPTIDRKYRTLASRDNRGVVGKSSGGYGALYLAMRNAGVFGAAASHSADMAFEWCYLPEFPHFATQMRRYGDVAGFVRRFESAITKDEGMFKMINVLGMALAYSPNPDAPFPHVDLPFDLETCEIDDVVWQRWLEKDPVRMVESHAEALRSLRLLYVECGNRDEFNLHLGVRTLRKRLKKHRVRHVYKEFEGGHFNTTHRYDISFPLLWKALAPQGSAAARRRRRSRK